MAAGGGSRVLKSVCEGVILQPLHGHRRCCRRRNGLQNTGGQWAKAVMGCQASQRNRQGCNACTGRLATPE